MFIDAESERLQRRLEVSESERRRLKATLDSVYRHVGSMLPERLDPVNLRLHKKAMNALLSAYMESMS